MSKTKPSSIRFATCRAPFVVGVPHSRQFPSRFVEINHNPCAHGPRFTASLIHQWGGQSFAVCRSWFHRRERALGHAANLGYTIVEISNVGYAATEVA